MPRPYLCRRPEEARPCQLHSIQPPCQQESRLGFPETAPAPTCPALWPSSGTHTPLRPAGLPAPGPVVDRGEQPHLRHRTKAGEDDPPHGLCPEGLQRSPQTQLTPPKRAHTKAPVTGACVCVHACVCAHVGACMCVYTVRAYMCACAHAYVYMCGCACMHARVYVCVPVCVYMCACVVMHVCDVHGIRLAFPKVIPTRPSWVLSDKGNLSFGKSGLHEVKR